MKSSAGSHLQQLPIPSQQIDGDFHITCHTFSPFLKFAPLKGHIEIISYFTCRRKITVSHKCFSTSKALSSGYQVLKSAYQEGLLKMLFFSIVCWYSDHTHFVYSVLQYNIVVFIYVRHIPLYILYNLGRTTKMFLLPIHTFFSKKMSAPRR